MLGLSGCFWTGPLTPEIESLSERLRGAVSVSRHGSARHAAGPTFRVSLTTNRADGANGQPAVSDDGAVSVFFDGWAARPAVARSVPLATYALHRYLQHGIDALRGLDGAYNVIVCEPGLQRARIVSSRYSYLPVFHVTKGNGIYFSPGIRALFAAGICEPEVVDEECLSWLLFGRYLRDETKFRDVRLLPRGSAATWSGGDLQIDTLPSFQYRNDGVADERLVDDLAETFRASVQRRMAEEPRVALGLSGGFDSRLILGAIDPARRRDVFAFTWGDAGNDDMRIAATLADAAGIEHREYHVPHEEYLARARDGVLASDGLSLHVHGFYPPVYDRVRRDSGASSAFNGIGLDVLLGGLFLDRAVLDGLDTRRELIAHYGRTLTTFSRDEFARLCTRDGAARFDEAMATLGDRVAEIPGDRVADISDQFHFETRTHRWIALAFPLVRESLETMAPCYDNDFLAAVARVAPPQRFNRRLYVDLLCRVNPELSRIEYHKTMMPACVPSEYWGPFVEIEQRKEQAHYELWQRSDGRVYLPYRHYAQNFVEWFRVHQAWREFLQRTLVGADSMLAERLFERRTLQALIDDHVEGRANRFRQLNLLVSLELFCRLFQGGLVEASGVES